MNPINNQHHNPGEGVHNQLVDVDFFKQILKDTADQKINDMVPGSIDFTKKTTVKIGEGSNLLAEKIDTFEKCPDLANKSVHLSANTGNKIIEKVNEHVNEENMKKVAEITKEVVHIGIDKSVDTLGPITEDYS